MLEKNIHHKFQKEYPYLYELNKLSEQTQIIEQTVDAASLISPWRLDLMSKLLVAESRNGIGDKEKAEGIYKEHLMAFADGVLIEAGQTQKRGLIKYYETFDKILSHTADSKETIIDDWPSIPVDKRYLALDGAHRTSAAIFYNQKIKIYQIDIVAPHYCIYDFAFFRRRCMPEVCTFELVMKYVQMRECSLYVLKNMEEKDLYEIYEKYYPLYMKKVNGDGIVLLDVEWSKLQGVPAKLDMQYKTALILTGKENVLNYLEENRAQILKETKFAKVKRIAVQKFRHAARLVLRIKDVLRINERACK